MSPSPRKRALPLIRAARRPPCRHLGDVVAGCATCGPGGKTRECDVFGSCTLERTKGKELPVCADCTEYVADPDLLPAYPLLVPPPPPLALFRTNQREALVTVAAGEVGRELLAITGPAMRRFADRVGADFVALDWPGHPAWPMSAKFAIPRALDHYERILYADADVLFRPGCVNPFDLCGPGEMGVVDELHYHRANPRHRREAEYQGFRRRMGFREIPHLPWYFNAGVMVAPRSHKHLLEPPARPIVVGHCAEQDHTNARLLDSGLPYRLLDRRANWNLWSDPEFRSAPPDAVLHWSGAGGDPARRLAGIRAALRRGES